VKWLAPRVADVLAKGDREVKLFTDKCVVVMEGPQFSTRAESKMYRQWGGDLINMTALPEAKLAREAELRFGGLFRHLSVLINLNPVMLLSPPQPIMTPGGSKRRLSQPPKFWKRWR